MVNEWGEWDEFLDLFYWTGQFSISLAMESSVCISHQEYYSRYPLSLFHLNENQ